MRAATGVRFAIQPHPTARAFNKPKAATNHLFSLSRNPGESEPFMFNITTPTAYPARNANLSPKPPTRRQPIHFAGGQDYDKNDLFSVKLIGYEKHPLLLAREVAPHTDNPEVMEYLVQELSKVKHPTNDPIFPMTKATLLQTAVGHGAPPVVETLLNQGADPLVVDNRDKNAFDWLEKTPAKQRTTIQNLLIRNLSERVKKAETPAPEQQENQGGWLSWFGRGNASTETSRAKTQPVETSEVGIQTEPFVSEQESSLATELDQLKLSSKATQKLLDKTKHELSTQEAKVKDAQEKSRTLEKQLNPFKKGNSTLQSKVGTLEAEKSQLQEQLNEQTQLAQSLRESLDEQTGILKRENQTLQEKTTEQTQRAAELQVQLTALNETLQREKAELTRLSDKAAKQNSNNQKEVEKELKSKAQAVRELKQQNNLLRTQVQKLETERTETQKKHDAQIQAKIHKAQEFETQLNAEKTAHHQTQSDSRDQIGKLEEKLQSELASYQQAQVASQKKIRELEKRITQEIHTIGRTHTLNEEQQQRIHFLEQQIAQEMEARTQTQADSWNRLRKLEAQIDHERGLHASIQADQLAKFSTLEKQHMETLFKAAETDRHNAQLNDWLKQTENNKQELTEEKNKQARTIQNMSQSLGGLQEKYWDQEAALNHSEGKRDTLKKALTQHMNQSAEDNTLLREEYATYKELAHNLLDDVENVSSLDALKELFSQTLGLSEERLEQIKAKRNQFNAARITPTDLATPVLRKPRQLSPSNAAEAPF